MRILLLSQSYPPVLGGLQTAVYHLVSGLSRQGHEVRVVTNRYPRSLPAYEVQNNIAIRRWLFLHPKLQYIWHKRMDLFLASLVYGPITQFQLNSLMRGFRPEVVNLHFPADMIPFVLSLKSLYSFRLIVSLHGDDVERWLVGGSPRKHAEVRQSSLRSFARILCEADWITACSGDLLRKAQQLVPSIKDRSSVIYNGVDLQSFQMIDNQITDRPYIFAYGRLTHKKGFDLLIEAFAKIAQYFLDIDLIIAGSGEEQQHLIKIIQKQKLDHRILFWGQAKPSEVAQLLNGCQLVVIPSRQEPFGIVALEALASGKPVIASRVGGLIEILDKTQAMLVDPSIDSLAQALSHWLSTPPDWNSSESRAWANQFSWQKTIDEYEAVLLGEK